MFKLNHLTSITPPYCVEENYPEEAVTILTALFVISLW